MIDFLYECNINNETIKKIEKKCGKEMLYNLYCNEYQIKDIINYFKSIGINCIDEILVNYTEIFIDTLDDVKKLFENKKIDLLVDMINTDYRVIESL